MKTILYKITDILGWIFCETFFWVANRFYPNEPPYIIAFFLNKIYCTGNWFYNLNKEKQ